MADSPQLAGSAVFVVRACLLWELVEYFKVSAKHRDLSLCVALLHMYVYIYIYILIYVCVCVFICSFGLPFITNNMPEAHRYFIDRA